MGNSPVPGEFPEQRPVTRSFDVFFDLRLNKRLSKQWWGWWFETLSCQLWRQCNVHRYHMVWSLQIIHSACFTNVWRVPPNNLAKIYDARNHIYGENFKLKICTCAQRAALGTPTDSQLEILMRSTISALHKFRENILESSRNVSSFQDGAPSQSGCWELQLNLGFLPSTVEYYDFTGHALPCKW